MGERLSELYTAVGAVLLTVCAVFLALVPSSTGYEISLFEVYPVAFWLALVVTIFLGQVVILRNSTDRGGTWLKGWYLMLAPNVVLLLIPYFRYSLFGRGDVMTHLGLVKFIMNSHHFPTHDYYPIVHTLSVSLSYITGIEPESIVSLVPAIFSLFYVVSMYFMLKEVGFDRDQVLFILPLSSVLLYRNENLMLASSTMAFFFLPFVLYLFFKYRSTGDTHFGLLLIASLVFVVFFHPLVTLYLLFALAVVEIVGRAVGDFETRIAHTPNVLLVGFLIFLGWYYSFRSILGSTVGIVAGLLGMAGPGQFGQVASVYGRVTPDLVDLAVVGIFTYGPTFALMGLSSAFLLYATYETWMRRGSFDFRTTVFGVLFVTFAALSVVSFFLDIVVGYSRLARVVVLSGPILIGSGFHSLYTRSESDSLKRVVTASMYLAMFVLVFLSVFTLYNSPLNDEINQQVLTTEVEGMEWLFETRNDSLLIDEWGLNQARFSHLVGAENPWSGQRKNVRGGPLDESLANPPEHFVYNDSSTNDSRYLVLTKLGRIQQQRFYPNYESFWRYSPEDFRRLEHDRGINRIYDANEFTIYYVE